MRWSFAAAGMFMLGIIGVVVIILFQKLTTINENDYYLLKEITEAAMIDSIDIEYYRKHNGEVKIVREKFVENFTRRYAESTLFIGSNYIISFYDIMEYPPKVTLAINTGIENYTIFNEETTSDYNVNNYLSAILEYPDGNNRENPYVEKTLTRSYYVMPGVDGGYVNFGQPINIPTELLHENIKDIKINNINGLQIISPADPDVDFIGEVLLARLKRNIDWAYASSGESPTDYSSIINTNQYGRSLSITRNISYYDCKKREGIISSKVNCNAGYGDTKYDGFWVTWEGTVPGGYPFMLGKFNVQWKYKEYELN